MKLRKSGKEINRWKWGFLLILAINIAFVGVIAGRLVQVREPTAGSVSSKRADNIKVGTSSINRERLNKTIAAYLEDYQTDQMSCIVYATSSTIVFEGTYILLGYEVSLYIYFQSSRLDSGAIQLKITSFSIGTLSLLESEVLKYIKSSYKLPSFVEALPDEPAINISIQNLENDTDIYLEAATVGLVGDQSNFDIYKENN